MRNAERSRKGALMRDRNQCMNLIRKSVDAMEGYVPGEQPADPAIVKLNTNENPYPPSPKVAEALATMDPGSLRLYPNPVSLRLRERIAELHGCSVDNVFAGNGSDEVLALCTRAFVEEGGSIGYFNPSYSLYPVLAEIQDVEKRPVELGDAFEWRMPPDYRCSLFFLTNPNAPTSLLHPKPLVRAFCESMAGVVVVDEAYVDFAREHCMDLALSLDNVLVARTLSKSYSLAGLRVGYVVGAKALIAAMYKIKDSYNLDAVSQRLALAALCDVDYMKANVTKIRAGRDKLSKVLAGIGYKVYLSESNFLWVKPAGLSAGRVFESLKERKIFVRYFPGNRTGEYLRITIGTDAEIETLIAAISAVHGH